LSEEGLRDFLQKEVAEILPLEDTSIKSDDADFFNLVIDFTAEHPITKNARKIYKYKQRKA
jgi:hypothetical protein